MNVTFRCILSLCVWKAEQPSMEQLCYPAIRHADGDIIRARDCVLVKSGMRKKDIPYVAKIDCLWSHADTGDCLVVMYVACDLVRLNLWNCLEVLFTCVWAQMERKRAS